MYSRTIAPAPKSPFLDGKPRFGTFTGKFKRFDIRGLKLNFGKIPIPTILGNLRIFESMRFYFVDKVYIGEIELFNAHYFSFMETTLWNRKTKQKKTYRRVLVPSVIKIPRSFDSYVIACRTKSRYVRIQNRKNEIHLDFDFLGSKYRPPCNGSIDLILKTPDFAEASFLIPYKTKKRCQLLYFCSAPAQGWISTGLNDHRLEEKDSVGFFELKKYYTSLRTKNSFLTGLGTFKEQPFSFRLAKSMYSEDRFFNENVVFWQGKAWTLPPVKITRPYGIKDVWVIQDTENMVDLSFIPLSIQSRSVSLFIVRTSYHSVYGTFEGVLRLNNEITIELKKFPGIGKKILLRA